MYTVLNIKSFYLKQKLFQYWPSRSNPKQQRPTLPRSVLWKVLSNKRVNLKTNARDLFVSQNKSTLRLSVLTIWQYQNGLGKYDNERNWICSVAVAVSTAPDVPRVTSGVPVENTIRDAFDRTAPIWSTVVFDGDCEWLNVR